MRGIRTCTMLTKSPIDPSCYTSCDYPRPMYVRMFFVLSTYPDLTVRVNNGSPPQARHNRLGFFMLMLSICRRLLEIFLASMSRFLHPASLSASNQLGKPEDKSWMAVKGAVNFMAMNTWGDPIILSHSHDSDSSVATSETDRLCLWSRFEHSLTLFQYQKVPVQWRLLLCIAYPTKPWTLAVTPHANRSKQGVK